MELECPWILVYSGAPGTIPNRYQGMTICIGCEVRIKGLWGGLHMDVQLFEFYLLKRLFLPPLNYLGTFVENKCTIYMWL